MNTNHPNSLKELQALYSYQFEGPHIGIEVAGGWMTIFTKLCADVDAVLGENKRGFHWLQIKEKLGSARFYYRFTIREPNTRLDIRASIEPQHLVRSNWNDASLDRDDEVAQIDAKLLKLRVDAENSTEHICLACGEPGSRVNDDGYLLVLCPAHTISRKRSIREQPLIEWETPDIENNRRRDAQSSYWAHLEN